MYGQENIQTRRVMMMVVNVDFLRFLPFLPLAPGKWGEMIQLFHPFSCPITKEKKNMKKKIHGRRKTLKKIRREKKKHTKLGGEDNSTPKIIRSQIVSCVLILDQI